ncbi:MoaF C-terminal domain-containing protein [Halodesulfovibrio sp.]|uniref:MoaF-related domain-containing protein n=1 Tax=Halodesulfovibrio sp. TaxID=1912772 RepID=UPI002600C38F|nr:MoaF C-terminal domain-containing protein [Halodesulfovibrio sp.]MCT4534316.1 hypothetical protein [Halodesulfovibrio sp.]MCT4625790.1 hypothetical protein [Halodesulfovibrio sp.]
MRKISILLFLLFFMQSTACGMAQQVDIQPEDLVGKTLTETWRRGSFVGASYKTNILSPNKMRWHALTGNLKGKSEEVEYACTKVGREILQVSWREDTTGSQAIVTYNFKTMKMYGVIVEPKRDFLLQGSFTIELTNEEMQDRNELPELFNKVLNTDQ